MPITRQLFIVSPEVRAALSSDDVMATCHDLREMDLYSLPYPEVTIRTNMDGIVRWTSLAGDNSFDPNAKVGPTAMFDISFSLEPGSIRVEVIDTRTGFYEDVTEMMERQEGNADSIRRMFADGLIALLATRNIVKDVRENKIAKLGIGKKRNRYSHITTLRLPALLDDDAENSTPGAAKAPHLRRGHIRRQHYGPRFGQLVRKIWIEPCFVNADASFVSTRVAYKM